MGTEFSSEQLDRLKLAMAKLKETVEPEIAAMQSVAVEEEENILAKGSYLKVDEDEMAAWLYLAPPEPDMNYTKQDLIDYLASKGVIEGLHQSNLSAMIKKKVYDREILVARGREVQDGANGFFEYLFKPEEYGIPKVREDGTVDYTNVSALQNVKAGQKVAVYHQAVQSVDGCTVLGNVLPGKLYHDLPPMRGKGIRREDEFYYAQTDGKIEAKDGKIDIQSVHEIFGDVDMIIGKVEFFGDIIIHGNVEEGVVIRAGRNIEIHGSTSLANLYAGGDVVLSRGIQGGNKSKVSARGNVFADFIEHTTVEAGGMVQANVFMNANIYAKDKVIATGKKGSIIGGYIDAVQGVEAACAGNTAEIKTIIHCGYEAQAHEKLLEISRKETEIRTKIADLVDMMTEALRDKRVRGAQTAVSTEKRLLDWDKLKDQYFVELDKIEKERTSMEEMVEIGKGAEIKIDGNIYRGVVICVNAEQFMIERNTCYMKYNAERGVIEGSVIIHN